MCVLVFVLGISLSVMGFMFAIAFLLVTYVLACPICVCNPNLLCCGVPYLFLGKSLKNVGVDSRKHTEEIELTVRPKKKQTSYSYGDDDDDDNEENRSCCKRMVLLLKDPEKLKKVSMVVSILNPLLIVIVIGLVQSLIAIFIIYYVVDGQLFLGWQYFEPVFIGLWQYLMLFVETLTDSDKLLEYLSYITTLSISWRSLIDFSMRFEAFKFTILFLKTILYVFIGILDALSSANN